MAEAGAQTRGRGRLSSFDLLPPEADGLVVWAAGELAARQRTQTDIYAEFVTRCEALMREHRGELDFAVPSFSAFNRHSIKQARLTRRLDQTRDLVAALSDRFSAQESDNLTVLAAETIKSLVFHLTAEGDEGLAPKDAMHLAAALKTATQAQGVSSDRRRRVEAELAAKVDKAVDAVARTRGMSAETAEAIKSQILGVGT